MPSIVIWFLSILNRKGAYQAFQWTSEARASKDHKGTVLTKVSTATVRTGVEYKNLAANKDRETGALPWGEWLIYPFVIAHKGNLYGRIYVNKGSLKSTYYVNGEQADRETWLSYQAPSAAKPRKGQDGETLTLTVKLENLTAL